MEAVVIYESLTGNTRRAAGLIAAGLMAQGVTAVVCPVDRIDYQALSRADLVIVGAWTDGMVFFGQRPGRAHRLRAMPVMDGKRALVFCTYAIDAGKVLEKLTQVVEDRGATVLGGMALRRDRLDEGAKEFVARLLDAVEA
ncbi:MAG TPA: flavodoxin domain-containing protein [Acidimicrobiales bacterium]